MSTRTLVALAAALAATPALAQLRLAALMGDNMVLQQQTAAPIWGWDKPGQTVTVVASWLEQPVAVTANPQGAWMAELKTPIAGGPPGRITVTGSSRVSIDNILFGEVWLCSGQSNMEMPVGDVGPGYRGVRDWEKELATANLGGIRLFNVENQIAPAPQNDCKGAWSVCTPERARTFSAVAYFFGRELHKNLNVPIGLITADWGGTVCEAWTSEPGLAPFPEFAADLDFARSLRAEGSSPQAPTDATKPWWEQATDRDPGAREHWESLPFDDSAWRLAEVPRNWGAELAGFDGIVWFRRPVFIRQEWGGQPLELNLGPIDDMDAVYFDGTLIGGQGSPGFHDKPRRYTVPAALATSGPHVLTIRILDTGGPGGIAAGPNTIAPHGVPESQRLPLDGYWRYRPGARLADLPRIQGPRSLHANSPTALYNGMIAPVIPYAIRGAIWYQGESNRGRADQYRRLFPALIRDWRTHWGKGEFPFYFVQIAPFRYQGDQGETAQLREAQFHAMETPNTGMAVTMDIGDPADIHPANKQEVGRRLAVWALAQTYGLKDIECSGPLYDGFRVEGNTIRIRFTHAAGLNSRGQKLIGFQIAGADGAFVDADAVIDGETIVVSAAAVGAPAAARYGWADAIEPNLFNGVSLPAAPFRAGQRP